MIEADFVERVTSRLAPLDGRAPMRGCSDFDLDPGARPLEARALRPAAVLVPIVRRASGWTVLLTQRTADMPTHAGQIAFPGGRLQPEDAGPVAAALREAQEETGLERSFVQPVGLSDPYETVSAFHVTPVVAFVEPGFVLKPDPREVAEVFETPLAFLMDPANHQTRHREWRGGRRSYYAMPYENRFIWGATAGMIKALYDRLYG
jgi:8-oxo-dGTP pyrophosphatase MutT (NUDIX family)